MHEVLQICLQICKPISGGGFMYACMESKLNKCGFHYNKKLLQGQSLQKIDYKDIRTVRRFHNYRYH